MDEGDLREKLEAANSAKREEKEKLEKLIRQNEAMGVPSDFAGAVTATQYGDWMQAVNCMSEGGICFHEDWECGFYLIVVDNRLHGETEYRLMQAWSDSDDERLYDIPSGLVFSRKWVLARMDIDDGD